MAGFGNQTWGYQKWGTLGDEVFTVDGLPLLSSNLNSATVESFINVGWGSDTWGTETWGESGSNHLVTGLAMTMSEGLSGVSLNGDSNLILTGNPLTLNTGTLEGFSNFVAEAVGIEMTMALSYDPEVVDALGQELVMALGSAVGDANTIVEVSAKSPAAWGNSNYGFGVYGNQPVNTLVMAMSENFSGVDPAPDAEVTGQAVAMNLAPGNTFIIEAGSDTSVSGQATVMNLNNVVVDLNTPIDVSGFPLTTALNNNDIIIITECNVSPTGFGLTASLGTATNVLIWNEVNTGTAPVNPPGWQEVSTNAA